MKRTPSPEMIAQAAEWAAMLDDDDVTADARAACEAWCAADPKHRRTLERMRGIDTPFSGLDDAGREALRETATVDRRWRTGRRVGLGVIALVGAAWLAAQTPFGREQLADSRTAIGEQRAIALADGSRLVLDTATLADTDGGSRQIALYRGQLFAEVTRDPARPFVVETAEGRATALGTAFIVRREDATTSVTVTQSRVRVCAEACIDLGPGERAALAGGRITRLASVDPGAAASWTRGWIEADDRPLTDVIGEFNRYRVYPIVYDAQALAAVRVTGSYPLTDSDRAIDAIAATSGLRVERRSARDVRVVR